MSLETELEPDNKMQEQMEETTKDTDDNSTAVNKVDANVRKGIERPIVSDKTIRLRKAGWINISRIKRPRDSDGEAEVATPNKKSKISKISPKKTSRGRLLVELAKKKGTKKTDLSSPNVSNKTPTPNKIKRISPGKRSLSTPKNLFKSPNKSNVLSNTPSAIINRYKRKLQYSQDSDLRKQPKTKSFLLSTPNVKERYQPPKYPLGVDPQHMSKHERMDYYLRDFKPQTCTSSKPNDNVAPAETISSEKEERTTVNKTKFFTFSLPDESTKIGQSKQNGNLRNLNFDGIDPLEKLNDTIYDMIKEFLIQCFTMMVYRYGLQPKESFSIEENQRLGKIPVFATPDSEEYVSEVSRNIAWFLRKGILEGFVFHINMLNQEDCPITQERIIFKTKGSFSANGIDVFNDSEVKKATQRAEEGFTKMFFQIYDSSIEKLKRPWHSTWNISIGLNREFMQKLKQGGHGHTAPFDGDPGNDFFPWKKRPRLSQAIKLGLVNQFEGAISADVMRKLLEPRKRKQQQQQQQQQSEKTSDNRFVHLKAQRDKMLAEHSSLGLQPAENIEKSSCKLPEWKYFSSSSSDSEDLDDTTPRPMMRPISNLEIVPGIQVIVYRLKYPITVNVACDDSKAEASANEASDNN